MGPFLSFFSPSISLNIGFKFKGIIFRDIFPIGFKRIIFRDIFQRVFKGHPTGGVGGRLHRLPHRRHRWLGISCTFGEDTDSVGQPCAGEGLGFRV